MTSQTLLLVLAGIIAVTVAAPLTSIQKDKIIKQSDRAEDELSNLLEEVESSQPNALNNLDKNAKTKMVIQKTKIVIPYDDEKEPKVEKVKEAVKEAESAPVVAGQKEPMQAAPMPDEPTQHQQESLRPTQEEQMLEMELPKQQQSPVMAPLPFIPPQDILPMAQQQSQEAEESQEDRPDESQFLYPSDYQLEEQSQDLVDNSADGFPTYDDLDVSELDLSPRAVAEYLVLTNDFQGFEQALGELMLKGKLSAEQVQEYKDLVAMEYENLVAAVSQIEEDYLQSSYNRPENYFNRGEPEFARAGSLPLDMDNAELGSEMKRMQLAAALQDEEGLNRLLEALVEDYLSQNGDKMESDSQEYDDFLNWMENSLSEQEQPQQEPEQQESVEEQLETLPAEQEGSGEAEPIVPDTSDEKKLKKNLEAKQ